MEVAISRMTHLEDKIIKSCPSELSIYGQAHLELAKNQNKILYTKESLSKFSISFHLSGDITGLIKCELEESFNTQDTSYLESLFSESMNIVIGNILTNLGKNFDIRALISHPQKNTYTNNPHKKSIWINYIFTSFGSEQRCRLYFQI